MFFHTLVKIIVTFIKNLLSNKFFQFPLDTNFVENIFI